MSSATTSRPERIEARLIMRLLDVEEFTTESASWPEVSSLYDRPKERHWYDIFDTTGSPHIPHIVIEIATGAAIYSAKKTLDIIIERIQGWYAKRGECSHRKIVIYGPNGEKVKVVECDLKHRQ